MNRVRSVAAFAALAVATSGCAWVGRVGVAADGAQPGSGSTMATDVSPTGRYVVFTSDAENLVANDTNGSADVFLRDTKNGTTERVSLANSGGQAELGGYGGLVSADGRYVAFNSDSSNLLATADANDSTDVFLRDRTLKTTVRISTRNAGGESDGSSYLQSMTPDANFIVFDSDATNLYGITDQNFSVDVYVRDRAGSSTRRVSVATDGTEGDLDSYGGSISDDGRYVAFVSDDSGYLDPNDSGVFTDVFLRDRSLNTTTRLTVLADGEEADFDSNDVRISGDGKVVVFNSDAANLDAEDDGFATDVYAKVLGTTGFERISVAPAGSADPNPDDYAFVTGVSANGRYVLFQSGASNLLADPTSAMSNSFVRDRTTGTTVLAGLSSQQTEPVGADAQRSGSIPNAISDDGRYLVYSSSATDVLGPGSDSNGDVEDVFMRSNPVPFIFAVTPASLARGATGNVNLIGSNLVATGALITFGDGVTVNSVVSSSATQITVSVTVAANAAPGPRTPLIVQSGTGGPSFSGGLAFLPQAFTVT